MRNVPASNVVPGHPDFELLRKLKTALEAITGGAYKINAEIPKLFRQAIDEVIDTPRTGRRSFSELEKTEKTYIGTKMETLFRDYFGLSKGSLDVVIEGHDVDIKHTTGGNWMIPPEAFEKPCILLAADEKQFKCFVGLIVAHTTFLTKPNRDMKCSIRKREFSNILWLLREHPYPANFWVSMSSTDALYINETVRPDGARTSGNERIVRLFTRKLRQPIHRNVIQDVARQRDYMKRLRRNGGARDELLKRRIVVLWGGRDSAAISELGLPRCTNEEFISFEFEPADEPLLIKHGLID